MDLGMKILKKKRRGFTLIEFVLVIALSGILFLGLSQIVLTTLKCWNIALAESDLTTLAEIGFSRLGNEVKQIKDTTSLITATSNDIKFTDVNDNTVEYKINTNKMFRNSNVAVDNVNALSFQYLDKDGNTITSPIIAPSQTNVRMVRMGITVATSSQSIELQSLTKLRNVR